MRETLYDWFRRTHPFKELAEVFDQIASGVIYINDKGYVYGDLKPLNIMFDQGRAKILDVGISYKLGENGEASGIGIKSFPFAPPEQRDGKLSLQTDVYSFAAVLYEALTADNDFSSEVPPPSITRYQFLKDDNALIPARKEYLEVLEKNPEIYRQLSQTLRKALWKDPEGRHKNVEELNTEVQDILKQLH